MVRRSVPGSWRTLLLTLCADWPPCLGENPYLSRPEEEFRVISAPTVLFCSKPENANYYLSPSSPVEPLPQTSGACAHTLICLLSVAVSLLASFAASRRWPAKECRSDAAGATGYSGRIHRCVAPMDPNEALWRGLCPKQFRRLSILASKWPLDQSATYAMQE
jgi:hypothetical protein